MLLKSLWMVFVLNSGMFLISKHDLNILLILVTFDVSSKGTDVNLLHPSNIYEQSYTPFGIIGGLINSVHPSNNRQQTLTPSGITGTTFCGPI